MERGQAHSVEHGDALLADGALGLAALSVALSVVAMFVAGQDRYEWLWPPVGAIGGVAAILGWAEVGRARAAERSRRLWSGAWFSRWFFCGLLSR